MKTAENLLVISEEFIEYTPNFIKGNGKMSTGNRSDLGTLAY